MQGKRFVYSYGGLADVIAFTAMDVFIWLQKLPGYLLPVTVVVSALLLSVIIKRLRKLRSPFIREDGGCLEIHSGDQGTRLPLGDIKGARINGLLGKFTVTLVSGEEKVFGVPTLISNKSIHKVFPEFVQPTDRPR